MRNLTNTMIVWNPGTTQVALAEWPDPERKSRNYLMSGGACYREVKDMSFEARQAQAFIEAMHLIVRDKMDPMAVHRALLGLEEYRDAMADDMPGVR